MVQTMEYEAVVVVAVVVDVVNDGFVKEWIGLSVTVRDTVHNR